MASSDKQVKFPFTSDFIPCKTLKVHYLEIFKTSKSKAPKDLKKLPLLLPAGAEDILKSGASVKIALEKRCELKLTIVKPTVIAVAWGKVPKLEYGKTQMRRKIYRDYDDDDERYVNILQTLHQAWRRTLIRDINNIRDREFELFKETVWNCICLPKEMQKMSLQENFPRIKAAQAYWLFLLNDNEVQAKKWLKRLNDLQIEMLVDVEENIDSITVKSKLVSEGNHIEECKRRSEQQDYGLNDNEYLTLANGLKKECENNERLFKMFFGDDLITDCLNGMDDETIQLTNPFTNRKFYFVHNKEESKWIVVSQPNADGASWAVAAER